MCLELARSILACPEIDWDSEKALEKVREMGYSVRELGGQQEEEEDSDQSGQWNILSGLGQVLVAILTHFGEVMNFKQLAIHVVSTTTVHFRLVV